MPVRGLDNGNDPRIKQCVEANEEQLATLHHELGHIYYYLMYKDLRPFFKGGAHDGFHEAIGDTIVLSTTPDYLHQKGLVDRVEVSDEATINQQMKLALDKIAFLPFGKLIDEWRWKGSAARLHLSSTIAAGGLCENPTKVFSLWLNAPRPTSIPVRNTTFPVIRPTPAISSPMSCSSSFTGHCVMRRVIRSAAQLLDL